MRRYETIYIVRPNVGEEGFADTINKTSAIIENYGGTVLKVDEWGLKKLAYLIKKQRQGYYIYVDYAGTPAAVVEMERIFKIDDRIIKFMTVKLADSCDPLALKEEMTKAAQVEPEAEKAVAEPEAEKAVAAPETEKAVAAPEAEKAVAEPEAEKAVAAPEAENAVVEEKAEKDSDTKEAGQ